jgi:exopolysaccharide biosynthesis polyprenyl glycosylphosphotransferase
MSSLRTAHWIKVGGRVLADLTLFIAAFLAANYIRFTTLFRLDDYLAPIVGGAVVLALAAYVLGLYSVESHRHSSFVVHVLLMIGAFAVAVIAMLLLGYLRFDQRVGRGFMALGCALAFPPILLNHWFLYHRGGYIKQRLLVLADSESELADLARLSRMRLNGHEIVGRMTATLQPDGDDRCLGSIGQVRKLLRQHKIDRVVFDEARMDDARCRPFLRKLRYGGFPCSTFASLYENALHYTPLHIVSSQWLGHVENASRSLYFGKLKRLFDIVTSLVLLVLLSPALLAGMAMVRFFSPEGPVFFKQVRVGRFGRKFWIYKLRSMRTDAEKAGAVWSTRGKDARVFPGGSLLRKFRVDEIPQLLNVLRGEMSFVGPRPERPEFVRMLSREIPFYGERHMIQPGLTGWAQVCYPYGSSVEDARRKLEYDLYYLKNAGVIFDFLILLDTVRVVLLGGLRNATPSIVPPAAVAAPTARDAGDPAARNPATEVVMVTPGGH